MTSHDVTLEWPDGQRDIVTVDRRETVLEAALREGVRLPYDCRKGTCTACVGRLLAVDGDGSDAGASGESRSIDAAAAFDYRRPPEALTERERAEGYALLCIATARADCRVAVGPRVRAEIGDSPWG
ncbi:2Fe-2S iron-sulfur cluster-binding protein [Halosolutus halophilus]|uniref:2Fe-2S iron-sulfur cluster-binding protein n=1 Tax=Halosolutus halophilus TaxID=1552990 RepID=UPI0022351443|nr:2Fe-2S iron-sulfur cluster-binding protein [Halosolutus halophilus]